MPKKCNCEKLDVVWSIHVQMISVLFGKWIPSLVILCYSISTADDATTPSEILQNANVGVLDNPTCQDRFQRQVRMGGSMDFHICSDNS